MLLLLLALGLFTVSNALDNGVGRTPPMGWSSWQMFNRFVNETDIAESILALSSLKEFGYEYANFDGAWMSPERDPASNHQVANPATVPHGIKALADLAHANGIKFGLYSAVGNVTCQGNPGSWGFEQLDADQYAEWGVDYLKIDSCGGIPGLPGVDAQRLGFERMRDALNKTGRQVFINTCGMYGISAQQEANKPSACTAPGETGWAYTNDVDGWSGQITSTLSSRPLAVEAG
jgi:alpha-galactosidase